MLRIEIPVLCMVNYSCKDIRNPSLKTALLNDSHVLNRLLYIRICVTCIADTPVFGCNTAVHITSFVFM